MPPQGPEGVLVKRTLISALLWILGLTYALTFLLIALILSVLFPPRSIDPFLKSLVRGLFRVLFIRVEVYGCEGLDPERTVIYMANHSSLLDTPLVAGFVPGYLRGIEASRQHRWPLYGWVMRRLGNLPIEREDVHSSISTMRRAAEYLRTGGSLMIFPEGHRTSSGQLLPFKKLPFHLAKEVGTPIIPLTICGTFQINNKTSWRISPGTVTMHFGEEIGEEEIGRLTTLELRDLAEARIRSVLEKEAPPNKHHC
jgi:1-acyl-sn-glycerol-3-phosphate acyltransferase